MIGDTVNTAARVEEATRETGDAVLITEATRRLLRRDHGGFERARRRPAQGQDRAGAPVRAAGARRAGDAERPEDAAPAPREQALSGRFRIACARMSTETGTEQATTLHGGRLVARRLKAHGVTKLFTLSGGHLFSIYDGCREEGIDLVDVRHEQAAAFAAEGWAKVTRQPGVAALTAGPGRHERDERDRRGAAEPLADARPRRPRAGVALGPGLAAGDRPRAVRPAADEVRRDGRESTAEIPGLVDEALAAALTPHSGPTFVDFPLDHVFSEADEPEAGPAAARPGRRPGARRRRARRGRSRCCATPSAR